MTEKKNPTDKKNRRYTDDAVKWAGIGAGAAIGSAALAAAVLYATRAKAKTAETPPQPASNEPMAPAVKRPGQVVEVED